MQFFSVKSVEETTSLIDQQVKPCTEKETLPLLEALGRVLAADIVAPEHVPPFSRSTVDGFAVRASDTFGSSETMPGFLQVVGSVKMGEQAETPLHAGEAISIPTGGMLPSGADSVVMIEHCENLDGLLNVYHQVAPWENVIRTGEDVQLGSIIMEQGTRLRPQELGALASLGITHVDVYRPLRIAYFSSGDEIVPAAQKELRPGQIRDINSMTVGGLVRQWGGEYIDGGIVHDNREALKQRAEELLKQADMLVMSGGSSVGAKDYTTEVIQELGEPGVYVHGISIKPGKPTIIANANGKPVIGLPGHPASAMVIFQRFGKRAFQRLSGEKLETAPYMFARSTRNLHSAAGRSDYIRVRLLEKEGEWWAEPIIGKSGLISTLVQSDGLLEIAAEKEGVLQGELAPVIRLR
ncbi:molybdopterin molybdotransferase MoeA [Rubeoparvulum massiliense]|uniref:molybdopterin molybdotransferase MoeA n=1 Tax=Rubeoparvulum massiliense TaxID=1631346 RepID=UPI00065E32AA|nr:gephyrin-like molybdotransferase Glp [Rubeoparvulum massiliense]